MNREFLKQALNLFDTPEKWNSFLELSNKKNEINNEWYKKAKTEIIHYFINDPAEGWSFVNWNTWDYRWFLEDFGKESFCLWMFGNRIGLWLNGNHFESAKATALLSTEKYSPLLSTLRPDSIFDNDWKIFEAGNFFFDSVNDGHIENDKLAWYAGNKTEKFVEQVTEKVNRIRKSPELTQLLREINETCKK
ncbi:hypothetical protein [Chryseobacterium sp.]|uniref:hypothetical protein n=1 Tax=Chryseobacterium sp. TaxID=1871047 RepID=UPI00289A387C|nr:hypothetical protein [Chryseobacterium sp.]